MKTGAPGQAASRRCQVERWREWLRWSASRGGTVRSVSIMGERGRRGTGGGTFVPCSYFLNTKREGEKPAEKPLPAGVKFRAFLRRSFLCKCFMSKAQAGDDKKFSKRA